MNPIAISIVIVVFVFFAVVFSTAVMRNNRIRKNGIEAEAFISRIEEYESTDSEGFRDTNYRYYVTYTTQDGKTVEARLGKIMQVIYQEGEKINIKYLPEKPDYVVPAK